MQNRSLTNMVGAFFVVLASALYAILNCFIKKISYGMTTDSVVFCRSILTMSVLFPFLMQKKDDFYKVFRRENILLSVTKGAMSFLAVSFWMLAVKKMKIAECVAISLTTPLFITLMAGFLLHEKVLLKQWLALFFGFAGCLIIIAPTPAEFNLYSIFVIISAILWAMNAIIMKNFMYYLNPLPVMFFSSGIALALSMPSFLQHMMMPTSTQILLVAGTAILAAASQFLMTQAYKIAPITVVIPFDFTRLILTAVIGYLIFEEKISYATILGSIMIVSSALFIAMANNSHHTK